MTKPHAAKFLNIGYSTLTRWMKTQGVPFVRLSPRKLRFHKTDLQSWIDSRKFNRVSQ